MRILIAEDEPISGKELAGLVKSIKPDAKIFPVVDTIEHSVLMIETVDPELIFMDIELADGLAFEIFKKTSVTCPIIFTTAYNEYAIKAFEVNSIAYLCKPITRIMVEAAFQNYENMSLAFDAKKVRSVLSGISESQGYKDHFLVKSGNKLIPIAIDQVVYFFAEDKWVYLITEDKKQHLINYTLSQLEEVLNPKLFFRLNRQYVIRKELIDALEPYVKGQVQVTLKYGLEPQIVSRKQTKLLKEWLS